MAKDISGEQSKNYREALIAAEQLVNAQKKANKAVEENRKMWNDISTSMFGVSTSEFFEKVPKTTQDLANSAKEIEKMRGVLTDAGNALNESFNSSTFKQLGEDLKGMFSDDLISRGKSFSEMQQKQYEKLKKEITEGGKQLSDFQEEEIENYKLIKSYKEDFLKNSEKIDEYMEKNVNNWDSLKKDHEEYLVNKYAEAAVQGDIAGFIEDQGEKAIALISALETANDVHGDISKQLIGQVKTHGQLVDSIEESIKKEQEFNKELFNTGKYFKQLVSNTLKSAKKAILDFDQAISDGQKNTGIMFKQNTAQMTALTIQTAQFGMSVEDTVNMMGDLSDELRTTDFGVLSKAAKDFAAIEAATGVSSKEITTIAGELMRAGASSEDIKNSIQATVVESKMLGVNSKRVIQQMEKNITKMREFGFTGGIESLRDMAVEAERLRINVDEIFNVAKRARSIEGAMEMAAELQLAGGSFAAINPMDLLSAARKGPKEMQNILKTMGKDIGAFNKETGEFEFDPVDVDRLQIMADATGMSLDGIQKMIQKNAEDAQKMTNIKSPDFLSFEEKDKGMLMEMVDLKKDGSIEVKAEAQDLLDEVGIDDISMITPKQLEKLKKLQKERAGDLEAQARANASLSQAWERLSASFLQIFTIFEPAIMFLAEVLGGVAKTLTGVFTWVDETFGKWGTTVLSLVTALGVGFLMFKTTSLGLIKGLGGFAKDMAKGALNKVTGGGAPKGAEGLTGGGKGGLLETLANGFKAWGKNAKDILKGVATFAGAMVMLGGVAAGFAYVMSIMNPASMDQMLTMGASLVMLAGTTIILSKVSNGIDQKGLLTLALAMAIVGAAMIPFAFAAQMLTDVDMVNVLISLGLLTLVILGLALLGGLMSGPQILALAIGVGILVAVSAGLLIFSAALLLASVAFEKLASIDWTAFSAMGPALLAVIPGLLGFSLASLAFLNPLVFLGFLAMTATLGMFAAVMIPLSMALEKGAEGFERIAEGIGALKDATADLDFDKLEQLADMSQGLAGASVMANIASSLGNLTKSMSGGGSGGGGGSKTVRHEVVLKLNGRDLQKFIIDDTDLQS